MEVLASIGSALVALIEAVPNVVWSGIVASLITVLGVLITNLGLSKRHREQLRANEIENTRKRKHDASESALDRTMKLKRDIYLPAIEAVHAATTALGAMVDPTVSVAETHAKFINALGSIQKANAVSNDATVTATLNFSTVLLSSNMELVFKRSEIDTVYQQYKANAGVVDRTVQDHGRWVETQTMLLLEGPPAETKWNFVNSQIAFKQSQINEWSALRDASNRDLRVAQLNFMRTLETLQPKITEASIPVLVALRNELGVSSESQEEFMKSVKAQAAIAKTVTKEFIDRLEATLNGQT